MRLEPKNVGIIVGGIAGVTSLIFGLSWLLVAWAATRDNGTAGAPPPKKPAASKPATTSPTLENATTATTHQSH